MAAAFCRRSFLNYKNCLFQTQRRTGYVVLIPQTAEEVADCQIGSTDNLPDFSNFNTNTCQIISNKIAGQYEVGMYELNEYLEKKKKIEIDIFKELFEPFEILSVPFEMCYGVASALFLSNSNSISPKAYFSLSDRIFKIKSYKYCLKTVYSLCEKQLKKKNNFTEEQNRILKKFVWEGKLNGVNLSVKDQNNLKKTFTAIESSRNSYEEKWKISQSLFREVIVDEKFAENCPLDLLRNTAKNWDKPFEGPWIITLKKYVYDRFLQYCHLRESRFHVWLAYNQLCSKYNESNVNSALYVENLRKYRKSYAAILKFPSYAHLSIANKMAESVENVQNVLSELLEPAKFAQEKELYELEKFAYSQGSRVSLEFFDLAYWKRLYLKNVYNLDELTLRDYFPLGQVLLGLASLCEQLFGIEIVEDASFSSGWDGDVRYFNILDRKSKALIGGFYLDPYTRKGKAIGETNDGWFVSIRPKSTFCNSRPLSALIFSFEPPDMDKPSLLYFRDIQNLFEKFGMMLQFTLTEMNFSEVSGLSNIEWDASRLSGDFLKLWLYDKHTLESISGHYNSGEPVPSQILDNLCRMGRYMSGIKLSSLIYFSNLDLEMHLDIKESSISLMEKLWPQHFLFKLFPDDRHCYGFRDVISGVWTGSFYSILWSQILAADIFSAFEEAGFNNQEEISALGRKFRSTFLALGGGCDPKEVFKRFRGRDPNPKLLLKLLDINSNTTFTPPVLAPESEELLALKK